jgi:hypothetical protein
MAGREGDSVSKLVNPPQLMFVASVHCCCQLRQFATNRKIAGSIPDVVIGIFH